jgi:hypothetical protein
MRRLHAFLSAALLGIAAVPLPTWAWGGKGHTIVSHLAAEGFAGRMPAFMTTPSAVYEITYLGPEMDRLKGAGSAWDDENDPGHYADVLDNGTIAGVVSLVALPKDREAYDTALRAAKTDQYRQGYLPYSIVEGWQQLREDFAYWRVDDYAATHAATAAARGVAAADRALEEQLALRDLGVWGHFVGDACQPLHVTVHFNGWGDYPNPNGYTESHRTHSMFESEFVNRYVSEDGVAKLVQRKPSLSDPSALLTQDDVLSDISSYLRATSETVPRLYQIEKAGGFAIGSAAAVTFTEQRLAAGAVELRDLSVLAWQDSLYAKVGYPSVGVQDVLSGKSAWPQTRGD